MKIAFWGPTPFAGRKSSNLLFMAVLSSFSGGEQLVIHADEKGSGPEHFLLSGRDRRRMMSKSEFGLELLDRMLRCERFDKSLVVNSSYSFAEGRVHVLPVGRADYFQREGTHAIEVLGAITDRAEREFQHVWIEAPAGNDPLAAALCSMADVVVINLAQSPWELSHMGELRQYAHEVFLIGAYEKRSVFSGHNIAQLYPRMQGRCAVIPYQKEYLLACLRGKAEEYLSLLNPKKEAEGAHSFYQKAAVALDLIERAGEERDVSE